NRKQSLMDTNIIPWQAWSLEGISTARAAGRPILVDFTANWCLTCNITVKPALEHPAVRKVLDQINAVAFVADYSNTPENITEELGRYKQAGVPLVLVYPKNAAVGPIVLPQPLPLTTASHYRRIVLEALKHAGD